MKMLFKMGSTILTLAFMTACGNGVNLSDSSNLEGTLSFAGAKQGMKGIFGKNFNKGDKGTFAQDFLNLTEEQKTKLKELRDSLFVKPDQTTTAKPDMATMKANAEAVKTAFKEAFLADTMDVTALKSKLDSLKPAKPSVDTDAHLKAQAEYILKSYQILTAEQRQTLETKKSEMDAKRAEMEAKRPAKPAIDANFNPADKMIDGLATKLTLTEDQKTKLKAIFEESKPAKPDQATIDATKAKRDANQKAIQDSLKAGTATVDSIKALLEANKPEAPKDNADTHLNMLVKIHDVLTAEQRKIAVDLPIAGAFGHGMGMGGKGGFKGGHGMGGKGEFKGGHQGTGKGFGGDRGFGLPF